MSHCSDSETTQAACLYEEVTSGDPLASTYPNYVNAAECETYAAITQYFGNTQTFLLKNSASMLPDVVTLQIAIFITAIWPTITITIVLLLVNRASKRQTTWTQQEITVQDKSIQLVAVPRLR